MHRQRVDPEEAAVLRVPHGDVPAHAFGEAGAGPVPEDGCHVGEGPDAVGGECGVLGYAWMGIRQCVVDLRAGGLRVGRQRTRRDWIGSCGKVLIMYLVGLGHSRCWQAVM